MERYEKTVIPIIEAIYESLTPVERTIGDFFIHNKEQTDYSARAVSGKLFVSEAALSRFSKKCGFSGYREFLFHYQQGMAERVPDTNGVIGQVFHNYQEFLNKSYSLINEEQMMRVCGLLSEKKKVYVCGIGSSGLTAMEMKLRFMRIGLNIEAITDSHVMKMNSVLLDKDCLMIGISISGKTRDVINSLLAAKARGARTILLTSRKDKAYEDFCDEILFAAVKEYLENGNAISPQFPALILLDILYAFFLKLDTGYKEQLHNKTVDALLEIR